jgi:hypothetical protein
MTMDATPFISGLLGGAFALFVFLLGQVTQNARLRRSMIEALLSEANANELMINKSMEVNQSTIDAIPTENRVDNETTIDDESKVYVAMQVDIPLETWVNQNVSRVLTHFNSSALIDYKLQLMRVNYLVERNKGFRHRVHFLTALIAEQKKLKEEIRKLKDALSHSGLLRTKA